ncbi:MAG: FAD-dependent oxidoreductase [Microbacteriaceae bacterium]
MTVNPTVDVVVIGGGIAGAVAALECAKFGLAVTLVDDGRSTATRTIALSDVAGIDTGAESFVAGDAIDEMCAELGIEREVLRKRNTLLNTGVVTGALPADIVAGIPGNPFAAEVATFAPGARFRAYADRVMPMLKIGRVHGLAALVKQRLGRKMLVGLTDPYCRAVYRLPASEVDLDCIAPTFNSTLTSLGTLSGAALSLSAEPAEQLRVLGGMTRLTEALQRQLENYAVTSEQRHVVTVDRAEEHWLVTDESGAVLRARTVIAAVDPAGLGWPRPEGADALVEHRTIVIALVRASQVTEATGALWSQHPVLTGAAIADSRSEQLHQQLADGQHVLQLTLREQPSNVDSVIAEAAALLGLGDVELLEHDVHDWPVLRPWVGSADPIAGERVVDESETLEWTGQWVSGPGLARTVTHAREAAQRIRRAAVELRVGEHS